VKTGFSPALQKPSCAKQSHEWSLSGRSRRCVSGGGGGQQHWQRRGSSGVGGGCGGCVVVVVVGSMRQLAHLVWAQFLPGQQAFFGHLHGTLSQPGQMVSQRPLVMGTTGASQKPTAATHMQALFSLGQQLGHLTPGVNFGFSPALQKLRCAKQSHVCGRRGRGVSSGRRSRRRRRASASAGRRRRRRRPASTQPAASQQQQ